MGRPFSTNCVPLVVTCRKPKVTVRTSASPFPPTAGFSVTSSLYRAGWNSSQAWASGPRGYASSAVVRLPRPNGTVSVRSGGSCCAGVLVATASSRTSARPAWPVALPMTISSRAAFASRSG